MGGVARTPLYLVDTSAWIDALTNRPGAQALRARVDALASDDLLATVGVVRFELLQGARSEDDWQQLSFRLAGLPELPTTPDRWTEAARIALAMRRRGQPLSMPDLLIAAVAIAHGATVLHRDRHFDLIAQHEPLEVESYVDAPPDAPA